MGDPLSPYYKHNLDQLLQQDDQVIQFRERGKSNRKFNFEEEQLGQEEQSINQDYEIDQKKVVKLKTPQSSLKKQKMQNKFDLIPISQKKDFSLNTSVKKVQDFRWEDSSQKSGLENSYQKQQQNKNEKDGNFFSFAPSQFDQKGRFQENSLQKKNVLFTQNQFFENSIQDNEFNEIKKKYQNESNFNQQKSIQQTKSEKFLHQNIPNSEQDELDYYKKKYLFKNDNNNNIRTFQYQINNKRPLSPAFQTGRYEIQNRSISPRALNQNLKKSDFNQDYEVMRLVEKYSGNYDNNNQNYQERNSYQNQYSYQTNNNGKQSEVISEKQRLLEQQQFLQQHENSINQQRISPSLILNNAIQQSYSMQQQQKYGENQDSNKEFIQMIMAKKKYSIDDENDYEIEDEINPKNYINNSNTTASQQKLRKLSTINEKVQKHVFQPKNTFKEANENSLKNNRSQTPNQKNKFFDEIPKQEKQISEKKNQQGSSLVYVFKNLIEKCQSERKVFSDEEFPPNSSSIGIVQKHQIEWKRSSAKLPNQNFFNGQIRPFGLVQSILQNNYFLAAFAALSDDKNFLEQLFMNLKINEYNCYALRFIWKGMNHIVILDDFFPFDTEQNQFIFAKTMENELFLMLVEKAWAKLHTSYQKTSQGLSMDAFHDLTGAGCFFQNIQPVTQVGLKESQKLWELLQRSTINGFKMVCSTVSTHDLKIQNQQLKMNLIIIGVYDISIQNKRLKILKMRNPFINYLINFPVFPYQYVSNLLKNEPVCGINQLGIRTDGIFFMIFEEFCNRFKEVTVCCYNSNFIYEGIRMECSEFESQFYFKVEIEQQGFYQFQVSQTSSLLNFSELQEQSFYNMLSLRVEKEDQTSNPIFMLKGKMRDLVSQQALQNLQNYQPGIYNVYVKMKKNSNNIFNNLGFGVYGPKGVTINPVERWKVSAFAEQAEKLDLQN